MARWRTRRALGLVLAVGLAQAVLVGVRADRDPTPFRTFHAFDVTLARTVKVMRGEAWAQALPVADLVPNTWYGYGPPQMWAAVPGNTSEVDNMYKKQQPLFFLMAGAVPAALGLGPVTLRMGPMSVLWLMAALLGWTAHRLAGPRGLVAAVVLTLLLPTGWQTAMMSLPGLGMMCGAALVLAAVVASDGLRSLPGAVAVGACVAVASWMGESAGDTVQSLAVVLPAVVAGGAWGVLRRGTLGQRLSAVVGMALALGIARACIDVPWILRHTEGYILSEASGGGRPPDLWSFVHRASTEVAYNLVNGYFETLAWSLLTPSGAVVVVLGLLGGLLAARRGQVVWALAGPAALLVLLSIPEKTGDYYALAGIPGIVLAASLGLSRLRAPGMLALAASGLALTVVHATVVHLDLRWTQWAICTPTGGLWLLQDPLACAPTRPDPKIRPTFRIARELPGSPETRRLAVNQWLNGLEMSEIWPQIPTGSVIWVVGGNQGPMDTAQVVALTRRPDLLVRQVAIEAHSWQARPDLGAPADWVFLLGEVRAGNTVSPKWPRYMADVEDYAGTGDIRIGRLPSR